MGITDRSTLAYFTFTLMCILPILLLLPTIAHIMQNCLCKYCKKELIYLTCMLIYEPINAGDAGRSAQKGLRGHC